MCGHIAREFSLILFLLLQVGYSVPMLMMFWRRGGFGYFIVSCCLFVVGIVFSLLRLCLGFSSILKIIANVFITLFLILELIFSVWSAYMAYLFTDPFALNGGWADNCPKNTRYDGYWANPDCDEIKGWYILGIAFSIAIVLQSFCIIGVSIEIMKSHSRERKEPPVAGGAEGEPLLSNGAPRYNPNGAKYV